MRQWLFLGCGAWVFGCSSGSGPGSDGEATDATGIPLLGDGAHTQDALDVEVIADGKMDMPRDLEFNPEMNDELWVVCQATDSVTVIYDAGQPGQSSEKFDENVSGPHFLAQPSGLAFGANGTMATIHNTDEKTQGVNGTPGDFMGPTLWTTDTDIFDGGHNSHMDMLHNSPLGKGITHEVDNVYWVFDGEHSALTRYDFVDDHGLGGTDHSDAIVARYASDEVQGDSGNIPSHMWYDADTSLLYVADTGNNRIAVLDTLSGSRGINTTPNYDGTDQYKMTDDSIWTLVDGDDVGMEAPSGIAMHDGVLYVSDAETRRIHAFDMDGVELDWVDLDHDINGIEIYDDALWFVDPEANEVLRIRSL